MKMNGTMSEINWIANFRQTHPRARLQLSVATLAKLCSQWYPKRYQTVAQYAVAEYTVDGYEHTFRWRDVSEDWFLDHFLGVDYLYQDANGNLVGLDLTLNPNLISSKANKHWQLRGIFNHLGITPYVLLIGEEHDLNADPTLAGITSY